MEVLKNTFELQKNNVLLKGSQVSYILSVMTSREPSSMDQLVKAMEELNKIDDLKDNPNFSLFCSNYN